MAPPRPKTLSKGALADTFKKFRRDVNDNKDYTDAERKRLTHAVRQALAKEGKAARTRQKASDKLKARVALDRKTSGRWCVTVSVYYEVYGRVNETWQEKARPLVATVYFDRKPTDAQLDMVAYDEIERIHYVGDGQREVKDKRQVEYKELPKGAGDIGSIRSRDAGVLARYGVDNSFDTGRGTCVFDYIQQEYGQMDGFRKLCKTKERIALAMLGVFGVYNTTTYRKPNEELIEKLLAQKRHHENIQYLLERGASGFDMQNFAKACGIMMCGLDQDDDIFLSWMPEEKRTHNNKMLAYRLANNHIYPYGRGAESKSLSQRILRRKEGAWLRKGAYHWEGTTTDPAKPPRRKGKNRNLVSCISRTVAHENCDGRAVLEELVAAHGVMPLKIRMSDSGVEEVHIATELHVMNKSYDECRTLCARLGLQFDGQGFQAILHTFMARWCPAMLGNRSYPNPHLQDILRAKGVMRRTHHGLTGVDGMSAADVEDAVACGEATCVDQRKAFPSSLVDPLDDFMVFDFNDQFAPYDGTPLEDLELGLYYVQTDDYSLLHGRQLYGRRILQKAARAGIPFTITDQVHASQRLPKDTFRSIVTKIVEYSHDLGPDVCKTLLVMLTGFLGKHSANGYSDMHLNKDQEQIAAWAQKHGALTDEHLNLVIRHGVEHRKYRYDLFGFKTTRERCDHHIPIYITMLDDTNSRLYNLWEGRVPLHRKVDSVTFMGKPPQPLPDWDPLDMIRHQGPDWLDWHAMGFSATIDVQEDDSVRLNLGCNPDVSCYLSQLGTFRQAPLPKILYDMQPRDVDLDCQIKPWKAVDGIRDSAHASHLIDLLESGNLGGVLVRGGPGNGKTWLAERMLERFGPLAIAPAFTNKATNNLQGSTISKFVGHNLRTQKMGRAGLQKELKAARYIIVDEVSMVPMVLWRCLVEMKRSAPHLKFVLLGDPRQLPPVEPHIRPTDYFEHVAVKYLADFNMATLEVLHRFDSNVRAVLDTVWEGSFDEKAYSHDPHKCRINIAARNVTVRYINREWNQRETKRARISVLVPGDPRDEHTQDTWLYPGLPLISRGYGEAWNQEACTLLRLADDELHCCSERKGKTGPYCCSFKVPLADFHKAFTLGYASTVYKVQGDTTADDFAIWEWHLMEKHARYTAVSRCRQLEQVHFGRVPEHVRTLTRRAANIQVKLDAYMRGDLWAERFDPHAKQPTVAAVDAMDAAQDHACFYCHRDMLFENYGPGDPAQFSLDRPKNSQGHAGHNWLLCCWGCNRSTRTKRCSNNSTP